MYRDTGTIKKRQTKAPHYRQMHRRREVFLCFNVDCDPGLEFYVETVCLLSKLSEIKNHISVKADMDAMDVTAAYLSGDPGPGAGALRILCVAPEYREDETEVRDHRAEE